MLILASASRSRKNLLEKSDIDFIQIDSLFDESSVKNNKIKNLALELAFYKAKSVISKIPSVNLINSKKSSLQILGCDSIFEFKGKAFGKPLNKEVAYERWLMMSSGYGYLHTGHCLLFCNIKGNKKDIIIHKEVKQTITSKIYFSSLQIEEIKKYVDSLEPLYCAGGFALEGRGGKYIEKIDGCFSNVMGLSLPWLREELLKEGILA